MRFLFAVFALFPLGVPAASEPMWFKNVSNGGNCRTCNWTIAEGNIEAGTPEAFREHLSTEKFTRLVVFNSKGGNLGAALELGQIIREHNLATGVGKSVTSAANQPWYNPVDGGTCESACAFAFFAGAARFANEDNGFAPRSGKVGVHQFFKLDGQNIPSADTQQIMGQVLAYLLDLGINPEILSIASKTPPDQMYYFTREELHEFGILTSAYSETLDVFIDRGGLAIGWRDVLENGDESRSSSLRCSTAAESWVLSIRDHGIAPYTTRFDMNDPSPLYLSVQGQSFRFTQTDIQSYIVEGNDHVIDIRLPASLPVFAGSEFSVGNEETHAYLQPVYPPSWTLPDAETFSVLARACGD